MLRVFADVWKNIDASRREKLVEAYGKRWEPFAFNVLWQDYAGDSDPRKRVFRAHFRRVFKCDSGNLAVTNSPKSQFEASEVMFLGRAKTPVVKLSVHGESFMFNMIRHMVGMAVAVARGAIPLSHVEVSLATNALCTVPLAPPDTLVLSENEFQRFRNNNGVSPAVDASGDVLTLRQRGTEARAAFVSGALAEEIGALSDPRRGSWESWTAALDELVYDENAVSQWLEEHSKWAAQVTARRAERDAQRAAAAAAADHLD